MRTWVTLTGDARAVAAAFGDDGDGFEFDDDADGGGGGGGSGRLLSPPKRRRRGDDDALISQHLHDNTDNDASSPTARTAAWLLSQQEDVRLSTTTTPSSPENPFPSPNDNDNTTATAIQSFLSPSRRRSPGCYSAFAFAFVDEPLRSPTEELSALSLGSSSDEDDEGGLSSFAPPPSDGTTTMTTTNVTPGMGMGKRRRGGLKRSLAGRFAVVGEGEGGGLVAL
ncbi:hypothetical protein SLS58_009121 [Diplodia intermedia]|uniref:Uncharacterized protein n=1 Tax=Diplodia intermedia TaxID=856260 RepID=A0ABR3TEA3_9PEZI